MPNPIDLVQFSTNGTLSAAQMDNNWQQIEDVINGLGTAADAVLTTSKTDTTADRVTKVGDFGLGALNLATGALTNLNDYSIPTGFYGYGAGATGAPDASPGIVFVQRFGANAVRQVARPVNGVAVINVTYERQIRSMTTYDPWVTVWSSANQFALGTTAATARQNLELTKVASSTDTVQGRVVTTGYLDIGLLDKTYWPTATSILTLADGADREVWVNAATVDAPSSTFVGTVRSSRFSSSAAVLVATPLSEKARYTRKKVAGTWGAWLREVSHELSEWVDIRPQLQAPFFWATYRNNGNHYPQIRIVDGNRVEMRGRVDYNSASAAPPNNQVILRVPAEYRPQMTSAGVNYGDAVTPLWFGPHQWVMQGELNYGSVSPFAQGNLIYIQSTVPNPVQNGSIDLSGIHYYLN